MSHCGVPAIIHSSITDAGENFPRDSWVPFSRLVQLIVSEYKKA